MIIIFHYQNDKKCSFIKMIKMIIYQNDKNDYQNDYYFSLSK